MPVRALNSKNQGLLQCPGVGIHARSCGHTRSVYFQNLKLNLQGRSRSRNGFLDVRRVAFKAEILAMCWRLFSKVKVPSRIAHSLRVAMPRNRGSMTTSASSTLEASHTKESLSRFGATRRARYRQRRSHSVIATFLLARCRFSE